MSSIHAFLTSLPVSLVAVAHVKSPFAKLLLIAYAEPQIVKGISKWILFKRSNFYWRSLCVKREAFLLN